MIFTNDSVTSSGMMCPSGGAPCPEVEQACAESETFDDLFPRLKAFASATDSTPTPLFESDVFPSLPDAAAGLGMLSAPRAPA